LKLASNEFVIGTLSAGEARESSLVRSTLQVGRAHTAARWWRILNK